MNDRNKYRAWNKDDNIMVYKREDDSASYWDGVFCSSIEMVNNRFQHDKYIWMQCIGVPDIKGKFIYESDIIRLPVWDDVTESDTITSGKVFWDSERLRWSATIFNGTDAIWLYHDTNRVEVIGNIFENPMLLKENNK